jgi:putative oxidoreductase
VVCSICLILGVATRPAAFLLGFTMVVAAFNIHGASPWFIGPGVSAAKEPALLYLVPMIAIIFTGAGLWSFDAKIIKDPRRRRW